MKRNLDRRGKTEGFGHRIQQVLVPSELVSEMKGRKKRVVERKLYPGYIMVEMAVDEETLYHVRGTQGVLDFVGGAAGGDPDPLPDHEVERILGVAERGAEEAKVEVSFKAGQGVKIKNGPFDSFTGVVPSTSPRSSIIRRERRRSNRNVDPKVRWVA